MTARPSTGALFVSDIAIIGFEVTGLACVQRLTNAGLTPRVFNKGRGIGGRVATRRAEDGFQFDHGAQMIPHDTPDFHAVLQLAKTAGFVAKWDMGDESAPMSAPPA